MLTKVLANMPVLLHQEAADEELHNTPGEVLDAMGARTSIVISLFLFF